MSLMKLIKAEEEFDRARNSESLPHIAIDHNGDVDVKMLPSRLSHDEGDRVRVHRFDGSLRVHVTPDRGTVVHGPEKVMVHPGDFYESIEVPDLQATVDSPYYRGARDVKVRTTDGLSVNVSTEGTVAIGKRDEYGYLQGSMVVVESDGSISSPRVDAKAGGLVIVHPTNGNPAFVICPDGRVLRHHRGGYMVYGEPFSEHALDAFDCPQIKGWRGEVVVQQRREKPMLQRGDLVEVMDRDGHPVIVMIKDTRLAASPAAQYDRWTFDHASDADPFGPRVLRLGHERTEAQDAPETGPQIEPIVDVLAEGDELEDWMFDDVNPPFTPLRRDERGTDDEGHHHNIENEE